MARRRPPTPRTAVERAVDRRARLMIVGLGIAGIAAVTGLHGAVMAIGGVVAVIGALLFALALRQRGRQLALIWNGTDPETDPVIFLDAQTAIRRSVLGHAVPKGYRLASLYFGTGLLDRTRRLDHGFPYHILDPIPALPDGLAKPQSIADLCRARAAQLVALSRETDRPLRLFWSGGIDSTAAAVCLMEALSDEPDRLQIFYALQSVKEYPLFGLKFVKPWPGSRIFAGPLSANITADVITVTGEHGDQLFGSMVAMDPAIDFDLLRQPWKSAFPKILEKKFSTKSRAKEVYGYLSPQIEAAPVPIDSLYEMFWWLNFSMKWQTVTLRLLMIGKAGRVEQLLPQLQHFYRTRDFEIWAMTHPDQRIRFADGWAGHKWPLKDLILEHTQDTDYHATKQKRPSLQDLPSGRPLMIRGLPLVAQQSGRLRFQALDYSLYPTAAATVGTAAATADSGVELGLWDDVGAGSGGDPGGDGGGGG